MRYRLLVLALLFAPLGLSAQPVLYPMVELDHWGYVDETGEWVIEPAYGWATHFHEGLAAVTMDGRCWTFIDASGSPAHESRFCSSDWAMAMDADRITPQPAADWYSEGLVPVLHDGGVAYADRQGDIVIEGGYIAGHPFSDGRGRVRTAERTYGFVDASGVLAIPAVYADARDFSEGLAAVAVDDGEGGRRWGFIDVDGAWAIEPHFRHADDFSDGLAAFRTEVAAGSDAAYPPAGYIDRTGEVVIEHGFSEAGPFRDGLAPVRDGWDRGYVDRTGRVVIEARYREAKPFSEGFAAVQDDGGWHFVTTTGERAFDHPMLTEVIHLESFRNGLARAVFSLRGSGSYSSMGSGDYRVFSDAFYGYFRRDGELVAVQSEEERATLLARIEAAEAEEAAEERRHEEWQAELQASILADCPDQIVYGDPAHTNVLEYGLEGKVRRLHFDSINVEETQRGRFAVIVPRILTEPASGTGWTNAHPASAAAPPSTGFGSGYGSIELTLQPEATFSSSRLNTRAMLFPRLDCLQNAPAFNLGELLDGWKSSITVTADPGRQGEWLVVESEANESDAALRLGVTSPPIPAPGEPPTAAARYLDGDALEARMVVDPSLRVAYVLPSSRADAEGRVTIHGPFMIPFPASGNRISRVGQQVEVYEFVVVDDELLVIDHHAIPLPTVDRREDAIITVPQAALEPSPEAFELTGETRRNRFVGTQLVRRELPALRLDTADRPPEPATLAFDDLPASAPALPLGRLEPYSTRVTYGDEIYSVALRDTTLGGQPLLVLSMEPEDASQMILQVSEARLIDRLGAEGVDALMTLFGDAEQQAMAWEQGGEQSAFVDWLEPLLVRMNVPTGGLADVESPEQAFQLLEELLDRSLLEAGAALYEARELAEKERKLAGMEGLGDALDAFLEAAMAAEHEPVHIEDIRPLLDALGVTPPDTDDPDEFIDAATGAVFHAYDDLIMRRMYDEMVGDFEADRTEIIVDPETGLPVARQGRLLAHNEALALDFTVHYRGAGSRMEAQNAAQGADALDLALPAGAFDAFQMFILVPFLELAEAGEHELYLVDVVASETVSYSSSEGSSRSVHLEPRASRLTLSVAGRETLRIAEADVPALRLRAEMVGRPPVPISHGMVEGMPVNPSGVREFEVLVSEAAPHHVLLVRAGDHELRAYPGSDARFPEADAPLWLVDR